MKVNGKSKTPITDAQSKNSGAKARTSQPASKNKLNGVKSAVLERISDGILALDSGMNYTYLNERAGELLGRSAEELVGKNLQEEFPAGGRTPFVEACQRALETQSVVWLNEYFPPTDRWLEGRVYPSADGVSVLFTEGTARKAVETEDHYRILSSAVPPIVWTSTPDGQLQYVNDGWYDFTGLPRQEEAPPWTDLKLHPDDAQRFFHEMREIKSAQTEAVLEVRIRQYDGSYRWFQTRSVPTMDENGNITAWHGVLTDIHDRVEKDAEQRKIIDGTPFMLARCSRDLRYLFVSRPYARMLRLTPEQVIGRSILEVMGEEGLKSILPYIERVLQGEQLEFETCVPFEFGNSPYLHVAYTPDRDEQGNVIGWFASVIDLTDRRQMEESLRESERKFNIIFNKLPFTATLMRPNDNVIMDVNEEFETVFGYTRQEAIGKTTFELDIASRPEERAYILAQLQSSVAIRDMELELHTRQRGPRLFLVNTDLVTIGGSQYILQTAQDITERRQAEKAIHASEEKYRRIVDTANEGIWEIDRDTKTILVNTRMAEMLGYTVEEMIGRSAFEFVFPEDHPNGEQRIARAKRGVGVRSNEFKYRRKDGSPVWVLVSSSPQLDEQGNFIGSIAMTMDITERKQQELALRASEESLRLVIESNRMVAWEWDPQTDMVITSKNFSEVYGLPGVSKASEVFALIWPQDLPAHRQKVDQVMEQGGEYRSEFRITRPVDGRTVWLEERATALTSPEGQVNRLVGVVLDISERKRAEQEMAEYTRQQAALFRLADQFNSAASLQDMFSPALDAILSALQCDRASILLFDDQDVMRFVAWHGLSDAYRQATDGHTPWKKDEKNARPVTLENVATADLEDWLREVIKKEGIGALAFIPLVSRDRLIGKFMIYFNQPHPFNEADIKLSQTIAHQLATNIERKRAEDALRQSKQRLALTYHHAPIGIVETALDGRFIEVNDEICKLLGYTYDELVHLGIGEVTHPEDLESDLGQYHRLANGELSFYRIEKRFIKKDGHILWAEVVRAMVYDEAGTPLYGIGGILDITERKQKAEELRDKTEEVEALMEVSPIGIFFAYDAQCSKITANPAGYHLVGMSEQSTANLSLSAPANKQNSYRMFRNGVEVVPDQLPMQTAARLGMEIEEETLELRFQDGTQKYVYIYAKPLFDVHGNSRGAISAMLDITPRMQREEELRARTEEIEALMEVSPISMLVAHDPECNHISGNQAAKVLLGLPANAEENLSNPALAVKGQAHWVYRDGVQLAVQDLPMQMAARLGIEIKAETLEMRFEDGTQKYIYLYAKPLFDARNRSRGAIAAMLDVTEQRKNEQALRESEERFSKAFRASPDAVTISQMSDERIIEINNSWSSLFGYGPEEAVGKSSLELNLFPDPRVRSRAVNLLKEQGYVRDLEVDIRRKSGELRRALLAVEHIEINGVDCLISILRDITERKQAEEALRDSEQRYRAIVSQATAGIVRKDESGRLLFVNQEFCDMLGYTHSELIGKPIWELTHEEDAAENKRLYDRLMAEGTPFHLEKRLIHRDGSILWTNVSVSPVVDITGRPHSAVSVYVDITGRRQAEDRLALLTTVSELARQFEEPDELMFEVSRAVGEHFRARRALFNEIDLENDLEIVHLDYCRGVDSVAGTHPISDYSSITTAEMMAGKTVVNHDSKLDPRTAPDYEKIYVTHGERSYVAVPLMQDGYWVASLWISDDKPREWGEEEVSLLETIAERTWIAIEKMRVDQALRDSEERLRVTLNTTVVGFATLTPETHFEDMNEAFCRIVGYSRPELLKMNSEQLTHPNFIEETRRNVSQLLNGEVPFFTVEKIYIRRDGTEIWVQNNVSIVRDENGKPLHLIAICQDITDRKRSEKALQESNQRYQTLVEISPYAIFVNKDGRIVFANNECIRMLGAESPEQIIGKSNFDILHPDYHDIVRERTKLMMEGHQNIPALEEKIVRLDGQNVDVEISASPFIEQGEPAILVTMNDITERKRAEEALHQLNLELEERVQRRTVELQAANEFLRESEATSRLILESMPDAIVIIDRDGQIVHANTQVETLFGYSPVEVMGQPVETLVPLRNRAQHPQHRSLYNDQRNRRIMGLGMGLFGRRKDETEFPVEVMLAPIDNSTNWDVLVAIRDSTKQRQAQEALRINEEKLRTLFEILPVGISFLDQDGKINDLNSALTEIMGLSRQELLSGTHKARPYIRADGSPMPPSEFASNRARIEQKTIYNVETGILKENGQVTWTSVNAAPVQVVDVTAAIVTIDITERKQAEEALHKHRERLKALSRRLVEVQEEERHAIARELHDRVGQNLAALTLNLNILRNQLSSEVLEKVGTRLNDSVTLVKDILTITRSVMTDLRPNVLDDYGLDAAIDEYAERFTQRYGIRVTTHTPAKPTPRLDPGVEMTLLRIAQEALTNIARHAQASQVVMTLETQNNAILMTIEDNGQGILSWQKVNQPGSHGLRIMRERAEAFGGYLKVHSTYKNGTKIEVKIPLTSTVQGNGPKEKKS